ncbi:secreted RxLR effector peptide protein, putative [Phytophthora infestans T30-4]|uniref:Secreted RxLR effector peptide protein, putative n=1 Tax=Phytophthora infestans (strain T30-4) TaxID=403677 RepID=D0P330_PHYIT|nr:secreted RxLR effector peptide protein, putative [Phytophthora infestans T30-4]EEY58802.1 secreted RxLR effector peptide protein, putative [Phytophthora infestans T30-4]|eukprot:XP_002895293.1 secreted RxLR effector peptide protein, putative [Phytophthora infestans T30-4]
MRTIIYAALAIAVLTRSSVVASLSIPAESRPQFLLKASPDSAAKRFLRVAVKSRPLDENDEIAKFVIQITNKISKRSDGDKDLKTLIKLAKKAMSAKQEKKSGKALIFVDDPVEKPRRVNTATQRTKKNMI